MPKSRITFIVPVYKPKLDILAKCVRSLKDQSLEAWDAVFVLDGPNNEAKAVIKNELGSKRDYKVIEIEHGGACKARNAGFEHASADIVCWWDCDCLIEPDTAETWLMVFDKQPEIGFVYSGYRFLDERGAINSEPFDPWTLRVRNYISTCFPVRRNLAPKWDETLKSLQDWDFWLSVVENGGKGKHLKGYAFATAYPDAESISGQGCTAEKWLERLDAVKKKHNIAERYTCVTSLTKRHEGLWLAKLIDADYQDFPTAKPHRYKTIIQVGFSFLPGQVEPHCSNFSDKDVRKIQFYTCDDITQVIGNLNLSAIWKYSEMLNSACYRQYVEDKESEKVMQRAGFNVEVMPMPTAYGDPDPMPQNRTIAVDIHPMYRDLFNCVKVSLPDVAIDELDSAKMLSDFRGLCHFHPDKTVSIQMRRAILGGRHVISNVQAPFMGYINDGEIFDTLVPKIVEAIRKAAYEDPRKDARDFYVKSSKPEALLNVIS